MFKNNNYKGKLLDKETQRKHTTHIKKLKVLLKKLSVTKTRYICHVNIKRMRKTMKNFSLENQNQKNLGRGSKQKDSMTLVKIEFRPKNKNKLD